MCYVLLETYTCCIKDHLHQYCPNPIAEGVMITLGAEEPKFLPGAPHPRVHWGGGVDKVIVCEEAQQPELGMGACKQGLRVKYVPTVDLVGGAGFHKMCTKHSGEHKYRWTGAMLTEWLNDEANHTMGISVPVE